MELGTAPRRPPAASDAEIRAYLLPKLRDGRPPTLRGMRADLGGGGFSRLLRIRKEIEAELAGDTPETEPAGDQIGAAELVAVLEGLFDKQWKALEEWEQRSRARLEAVPPATGRPAAKAARGGSDAMSAQADRLEAVERRLLIAIDKLQALTKAPAALLKRESAVSAELSDVPPAWARQAAAAATAALDGRLESMMATVRDAADGARSAYEHAAEAARATASDASLQMQMARSTLTKAVGEFANAERSAALEGIRQALQELHSQVGGGFAAAAATADRRAVAIRDVIIGMTEIEMAQCEMFEAVADQDRSARTRLRASAARGIAQRGKRRR